MTSEEYYLDEKLTPLKIVGYTMLGTVIGLLITFFILYFVAYLWGVKI